MALIEVDEDEIRTASAAKALLDKFSTDPRTRSKLLGLVKDLNPNAVIPELDQPAEMRKELTGATSALEEKLAKLEKELETRDKRAEVHGLLERERNKLRKAGWDDEGIDTIEKTMQERGFVDYEAAAALVEKSQRKAEPVGLEAYSVDKGWNLTAPAEGEGDQSAWFKGPGSWKQASNSEIRKFFDEKRGR